MAIYPTDSIKSKSPISSHFTPPYQSNPSSLEQSLSHSACITGVALTTQSYYSPRISSSFIRGTVRGSFHDLQDPLVVQSQHPSLPPSMGNRL
ncbi:hypothetical protein CDAR_554281 [Caerostris darwini]|uniref:Uncharacterized protein n=1 Tax=Caerostris darwini TaxID=1538125 RepID=A0AAV4SQ10_9ARAC|nr:hypothetical protein CDAR_554281 [Caerostris darwini]